MTCGICAGTNGSRSDGPHAHLLFCVSTSSRASWDTLKSSRGDWYRDSKEPSLPMYAMAWPGDCGTGDMLEDVEDTELSSPGRSLPAWADADAGVAPAARKGLNTSPFSS